VEGILATAARKDFELPDEPEPKPHELPPIPVNYQVKYQAAIQYIAQLETELEDLKGEAKLVSLVSSPIGFLALDDHGQMFEYVNDPQPRGPGPQGKMWVHRPGPKR